MRKLIIFLLMTFVSTAMYAQTTTLKGKVVDETGFGLPGVNVIVKGTTTGTMTDIDGEFGLDVESPSTKVLEFSSMGLKTVVKTIGTTIEFNITMVEDAVGLDEVVVTALGIKRAKKALGYSVTEIKADEISKSVSANPIDALQGRVAGVNIKNTDGGLFGGTKIQIRGVSTLGSNNQPIYVIDGVILDNATSGADEWGENPSDWGNELKNLNPDDFASISVLKGSAATALYGSRGINGAVIITTKGDGKIKKGLGVSISQTISMRHVYDTPDFQYEFGSGTLPGYVEDGPSGKKVDRFNYNSFKYTKINGKEYPTLIGADGFAFGPKFDGRKIQGYDGELVNYNGYKDNYKQFYRTGLSSNTNVTIQGGDENTTFYLSESYSAQEGVNPNVSMSRNSLLLKAKHKLSDEITVKGSMNFVQTNPKNNPRDIGWIKNTYDTDKYKDKYQADHGGLPKSKYGDKFGNVPYNSYWFAMNEFHSERKEQVIRPIVKLIVAPVDWASLIIEGNMNLYSYKHEVKNLGTGYRKEGGKYSLEHYKKNQRTGKIILNLNHKINDFSGNLMFGGEMFYTENNNTKVETDGLIVPGQYFLDNSKKTRISSGNIGGTKQINSLFFVLDTDWKDQVFLSITGRNDWSSALVYADGTGNNSYFYPSVSTSWLFSNTIDMPKWFSYGKIRASIAQVGNDTSPYFINKGYSISKIQMQNAKFIYSNGINRTLIDSDLNPERKTAIEFGTDIRLFDNRIGIDFTWYKENIKDQIVKIGAVEESGIDGQIVNGGELQNSGIEIALNTVPIKTKDFRWDLDFTYTKNKNKVISLHKDLGKYKSLVGNPTFGNYRIGSVAYVGGEYGVLLSDSKPKVNADGKKLLVWSDAMRGASYQRSGKVEKIGSMLPDFLASMYSSFKYKNFDFTVLLDARFGGYIASYTNKYGAAYGYIETSLKGRPGHGGVEWTSKYDGNAKYSDGIIPEGVFDAGQKVTLPNGKKQDISGLSYKEAFEKGYIEPTHAGYYHYIRNSWGTGVVNDDWFSEVNYIALRQISFGYTLPNSLTEKFNIKNLNLSFVGRNLGYLYNSLPNNLNPEGTRGNRSDYSWLERNITPYTATYSFKIKFNL